MPRQLSKDREGHCEIKFRDHVWLTFLQCLSMKLWMVGLCKSWYCQSLSNECEDLRCRQWNHEWLDISRADNINHQTMSVEIWDVVNGTLYGWTFQEPIPPIIKQWVRWSEKMLSIQHVEVVKCTSGECCHIHAHTQIPSLANVYDCLITTKRINKFSINIWQNFPSYRLDSTLIVLLQGWL